MPAAGDSKVPSIYWHRELPPASAEVWSAKYTVEATSLRVAGSLSHRDELWDRCLQDLMARTRVRLEQEVARRQGRTRTLCLLQCPSERVDASVRISVFPAAFCEAAGNGNGSPDVETP